ncbi:hypothetical protein GCM10009077_29900 [Roseibium denhamense]
MKRRTFLKAGALAAPATMLAAPAIAQGKIEWKLPTSFPAKAPGVGTNVTTFAERVAAMSDGQLTLKVFSGGELVPPLRCGGCGRAGDCRNRAFHALLCGL